MSSAKAALESDTRTLAWEAGKKWGVRVNCISAPPLASRAARAIGDIHALEASFAALAPLRRASSAQDVGRVASFLSSDLAAGVTGVVMPVDNGAHVMSALGGFQAD